MHWLPNDSSAEGASTLEGSGARPLENFENQNPRNAISCDMGIDYELQFDFKKEKPWKSCHISEFDFFCTPLHPC